MATRNTDPALEAIFTSMQTYMGTEYTGMNCTVSVDGAGVRNSVNCSEPPPSTNNWQYTEYNGGTRVSVAPMSANLGPGETQQFTATATDASGNPIASPAFTWSVQGALGTVSTGGLYTAPATIAAAATDSLRCSLNGANAWATLTISLHP